MRIYLSVPMIANRSLWRAKIIADLIVESGNELVSPWVLGEVERVNGTNIFQRDKRGVENCDLLVADVSEPSTGVGMEIMAAYNAGKYIVLVARRGAKLSRMLLHMDRKTLIEYDDQDSLKNRLLQVIDQLKGQNNTSI